MPAKGVTAIVCPPERNIPVSTDDLMAGIQGERPPPPVFPYPLPPHSLLPLRSPALLIPFPWGLKPFPSPSDMIGRRLDHKKGGGEGETALGGFTIHPSVALPAVQLQAKQQEQFSRLIRILDRTTRLDFSSVRRCRGHVDQGETEWKGG